jgi:hypothetical protein
MFIVTVVAGRQSLARLLGRSKDSKGAKQSSSSQPTAPPLGRAWEPVLAAGGFSKIVSCGDEKKVQGSLECDNADVATNRWLVITIEIDVVLRTSRGKQFLEGKDHWRQTLPGWRRERALANQPGQIAPSHAPHQEASATSSS